MAWTIKVIDRKGNVKAKGFDRRYQTTYLVVTDNPNAGVLEVEIGLGIKTYDPYSENGYTDLGALCVDIDPSQPDARNHPKVWHVVVTYQSQSPDPALQQTSGGGGGGGGGSAGAPQDTNPLNQPPSIDWGQKPIIVGMPIDIDGLAVANSAGDPFELQSTEVYVDTLTIVRNELYYSPHEARQYRGRVNSNVFQGYGAGEVLCDKYVGKVNRFSNGQSYAAVTYEFHFAPDNHPYVLPQNFWQLSLVDKGRSYLNELEAPGPFNLTGTYERIPYERGTATAVAEIFLNGSGLKHEDFDLTEGRLKPLTSTPKVKLFRKRDAVNFAGLDLPDPAF